MTQTLTEFIKQKETITNNDLSLENSKQESEIFEDSLDGEYNSERKDHFDYVNAHKMMLELDKIKEEKSSEESDYSDYTLKSERDEDLNEVVLDEDLIVIFILKRHTKYLNQMKRQVNTMI